MPEMTNRQPSRSPSPSAKRLRLASTKPAVAQTSVEHDTPIPPTAEAAGTATAEPSLAELIEKEMNLPIEYPRASTSSSTENGGDGQADDVKAGKREGREISYENKLVLAPMVRTGSCKSIFVFVLRQVQGRYGELIRCAYLDGWDGYAMDDGLYCETWPCVETKISVLDVAVPTVSPFLRNRFSSLLS